MVRFLQCLCFNRAVQPSQEAAPAPSQVLRGSLTDILKKENEGFGSVFRIEVVQWQKKHDCLWFEMIKLFNLLETNPQVKELSLADYHTDPTEEKYISRHLKTNTTLETFEVHANRMSETGMRVIMEALCENKTLKTFRADSFTTSDGRYKFDKAHAELLGKVLKSNHGLKLIDLIYCYIPKEILPPLAQIYTNLPERNLATLKFDGIFTLNLENAKNNTLIAKPVYVQENQSQPKTKM